MIEISIPVFCQPEVKYTFHCLMNVFLGLEYKIDASNTNKHFVIAGPSGTVTIKNNFFSNDNVELIYTERNIPEKTTSGQIEIGEAIYNYENLFGSADLTRNGNEILLFSDIISATFFMLTRWEEYASVQRDEHDRFIGSSSLAFRNQFIGRAVVNEYVEMMYALLLQIGMTQKRSVRTYTIVPTHDVDIPYIWNSNLGFVKSLIHSIMINPSVADLKSKIAARLKSVDLFDTFHKLMSKSEEVDVQAEFYFLAGGNSKFDADYDVRDYKLQKLCKEIVERGHKIGIHPSYNSYKSLDILGQEKSNLESSIQMTVEVGRQHYLRFSVPDTWSLWNASGLKEDSTMGYADVSGFRCGVCYPFPVFDILKRERLELIERPLIVMDVTLLHYQGKSQEAAVSKVIDLQTEVRKYSGEFVFLWHNSSFGLGEWKNYEKVFQQMYSSKVA